MRTTNPNVLNVRVIGESPEKIEIFLEKLGKVFTEVYPSPIFKNQREGGYRCFINVPLKENTEDGR